MRAGLLGLLQGVTEAVPVSSSAHLTLVPWLLRWPVPAQRTTFAAALHAGSALGLALALRHDVAALASTRGGHSQALLLAAATLPAAAVGRQVDDVVEQRLGGPRQLAASSAVAAAALWAADQRPQRRTEVTGQDALVAGLAQVTALVPGVSRAGATLTALRLRGLDRPAALRFSLLMSLPITTGAASLTLARTPRAEFRALAPDLAAGLPAAAAGALLVARAWRARPHQPLAPFAVYRLGLAAATSMTAAARLHRETRARG